MVLHEQLAQLVTTSRFLVASAVFIVGLVAGFLIGRLVRRMLVALGLPDTVEGTAFERTAQGLGSSTVGLLSQLVAFAFYVGGTITALDVAQLLNTRAVLPFLAEFLPQVFVATLAIIAGLVVGDKAAILVSERLRGVKLPDVGVIPELVRYSIFYIAALIALNQVGVVTSALLIMLAAYVFGIIFLAGIAFKDLLMAGAAGAYLLLNQPYGIGDRVRVGETTGIVQEMDMFVTHVESEGEEFIIPNNMVFREGVVRIRE
jgi:small-conductance mechanosensitive channel